MAVTQAKAKKMLKDGKGHGKALSKKQRGLFGAIAGGNARKSGGKKQ